MNKSKKKMQSNLIIIILLSILSLSGAILAIIFIKSYDLISLILVLVSLVLLIVLLNRKNKFEFYKHEYNLLGLIENKNKPFVLKNNILNKEFYHFLEKKYLFKHYQSNSNYSIYYKVSSDLTNNKKNQTLFAILIFHKDISYIGDISTNAFESLEKYLNKKEKYRQRVFYQFKDLKKNINNSIMDDTDHIFFLNHKRDNIVVLNISYNSSTKEIYYLHSNNFKPFKFLNESLNYLNNIINYK